MSDLLAVIPDFPATTFSHLLPSLDKAAITVADLLTLDAVEVAKRATVPTAEVRKIVQVITEALHTYFEQPTNKNDTFAERSEALPKSHDLVTHASEGRAVHGDMGYAPRWISTLDSALDTTISGGPHEGFVGGFPTGYVSEITGESATGKTTFLLTLLLSVQLPAPHGLSQPALYISTEAALSTPRLAQILKYQPLLTASAHPDASTRPSLARVLSIQCPDLESQEHILRYQAPVAIERHNVGLLIIDSIAANFRAEFDGKPTEPGGQQKPGQAMAERRVSLIQLGQLLRDIARKYDIAVVVANQVADRFQAGGGVPASSSAPYSYGDRQHENPLLQSSTNGMAQPSRMDVLPTQPYLTSEPLSLDHQQRFFTGWGHIPPPYLQRQYQDTAEAAAPVTNSQLPTSLPFEKNLKNPSLGLIWTNQIACRVALSKSPIYNSAKASTTETLLARMAAGELSLGAQGGEDDDGGASRENEIKGWRRFARIAFAGWAGPSEDNGEKGTRYGIWGGGIRSVESPIDRAD